MNKKSILIEIHIACLFEIHTLFTEVINLSDDDDNTTVIGSETSSHTQNGTINSVVDNVESVIETNTVDDTVEVDPNQHEADENSSGSQSETSAADQIDENASGSGTSAQNGGASSDTNSAAGNVEHQESEQRIFLANEVTPFKMVPGGKENTELLYTTEEKHLYVYNKTTKANEKCYTCREKNAYNV